MDLTMGLIQEQTQKLLMTTQMKQSLELLQCTAEELDAFLAEQVLNNPLTELKPLSFDQTIPWNRRALASGATDYPAGAARQQSGLPNGSLPLEQIVSERPSFIDQVQLQIREWYASREVERIALRLVGYLDESGYLREDDDVLRLQIGCDAPYLEAARDLLKCCEPKGIGAANLQECLLLQLDTVSESIQPLVACLIRDHLEDVAQGRIPFIAKQMGVSQATVQAAVDTLRQLNPRPAAAVTDAEVQYIRPEVTVEWATDSYVVTNIDGALSDVVFNSRYERLLQRTDDRETQKFLWKNYHAAQWLMRCIDQRRQTVRRVAEAIVAVQQGFFAEGVSGLRPLTLKQVADILDLHESTISRAVRGKFMQTPCGVFEFKYFFTAELGADDGLISTRLVKQRIRAIVAEEDPGHPYSDAGICKQLQAEGIHVSRRTIAKYREELDIPASSRRRRFA